MRAMDTVGFTAFDEKRVNGPVDIDNPDIPSRARDAVGGVLKRLFDIFVALSAVIMLAPLFILVAVAVKIVSPGPVLYLSLIHI